MVLLAGFLRSGRPWRSMTDIRTLILRTLVLTLVMALALA